MDMQAIPESVAAYSGRIVDVDSHEMMPIQYWAEHFGECTRPMHDRFANQTPNDPGGTNYPDFPGDTMPITAETVWTVKGCKAPGAVDVDRRLQVMDFTGVSRQLLYPSAISLMGAILLSSPPESTSMGGFGDGRAAYGKELLKAGNDWLLRATAISDRVRPVPILCGDTPDELLANASAMVDAGARAVMMMAGMPPGGVSPAHEALDPLWAMFAARNVAVTLHLGSGGNFLNSEDWGKAAAFEGFKINTEFDLSPWRLATQHLAPENFLATLVVGGVFDRHPTLRFGVIEFGAYWLGPLAFRLDLWHDNNQNFGVNGTQRLKRRPSEYIASNVRVTPYHFEPVDEYIDRYGLEDVYCYSSDYPHLEGGRTPMHKFAARLERFGPAVMEKFFATNGALLLPD